MGFLITNRFAALNPNQPPHPYLLAQQFNLIQPLPDVVPHNSRLAHHLETLVRMLAGGFFGSKH
jgi:hypothetical protein